MHWDYASVRKLHLEDLRVRLAAAGYASVPQVGIPGEFAIRGSLFDIFPMGRETPLRLDLLTGRSTASAASIPRRSARPTHSRKWSCCRRASFSLSAESIKEFRRRFRTRFEGDLTRMSMYRDVGAGLAPAGSEYYLPLFHESSVTLLDFLPRQAVIVLPESTEATLAAAWDTIEERYEERRYDNIEHPVLAPGEIFATPDEWLARARQLRRVQLVGRTALVTDADSPLESPARNRRPRCGSISASRTRSGRPPPFCATALSECCWLRSRRGAASC